MEDVFKLVIIVLLITILLNLSIPLINNYNHYMKINSFASDIRNLVSMMNHLNELNNEDSFLRTDLTIPLGYSLTFDNLTDSIIIDGAESLNISLDYKVLYYTQFSSGKHYIELYYGNLSYIEFINKSYMVVFN